MPTSEHNPTPDDPAANPNPDSSTGARPADPRGCRPQRLQVGGAGVFAGDWAFYPHTDGTRRVPVGFVGILLDWWNGHAVFACDRQVAEEIVAGQDRLRAAERDRLAGTGHTGTELTGLLDEAYPPMFFAGDEIVVDEHAVHGEGALSRIAPDAHGRYVVNGWHWTWQVIDPAGCDRVAGQLPAGEPPLTRLVHSGLFVPDDRLKVTSLRRLATKGREAFTAVLRPGRARVGTIDNDGRGGATMYHAKRPDVFGWRHLEQFVSQCRHRGGPVADEFVLDCLVDEYDLARRIKHAQAGTRGRTIVRLVDARLLCRRHRRRSAHPRATGRPRPATGRRLHAC